MKEESRILEAEGIMPPEVKDMVQDFKDQTLLNPRLKNTVGHISLSFSPKDAPRMTDALMTAADKLGMQYVATTHRARVETGADGVHTVCPPAGTGSDDSTILAALPQETLARLILPLGDFAPEDVAEMAEDFKV